MLDPCECRACVAGAEVDDHCVIKDVPTWLRGLVSQWWTLFGEPGRASYFDAPGWCLEVGALLDEVRAEQAERERDKRRQEEIARKHGLR